MYAEGMTSHETRRNGLGVSEIPQLGIVHVAEQRYTRVYDDGTQVLSTPKHIASDVIWNDSLSENSHKNRASAV